MAITNTGQDQSVTGVVQTNYANTLRGIAQDVTKMFDPYIKAKALNDSAEGVMAGKAFKEANSALPDEKRLDSVQKMIADISSTDEKQYSLAWKSAYLSQVYPELEEASAKKNDAQRISTLNAISTSFQEVASQYSTDDPEYNKENYMSPEEFVDYNASLWGLSKDEVRDAVLTGAYKYGTDLVESASSPNQLAVAMAQHSKVMSQFESPAFKGSKSEKLRKFVTRLDKQYSNTATAKSKQFSEQSKMVIDMAINNNYDSTPEDMYQNFVVAYPDPMTRGSQFRKYQEKYTAWEQAREFQATNSLTEPHGPVPKVLEDQWKSEVYSVALNSLTNGDGRTFTRVINSNKKYAKDVGDVLYSQYLGIEDPKELDNYIVSLQKVTMTQNGPTALNTTLGGENYAEILLTSAVSKAMFKGDLTAARNWIQQKKAVKAKPMYDDDTLDTVRDHTLKLGYNYKATMDFIASMDPTMAKQLEPSISEYYMGLQSEWDIDSTLNLGWDGTQVKIDVGMGDDITQESINPKLTQSMLVDAFRSANGGIAPDKIKFIGDMAYPLDKYGYVGIPLNARKVVDYVEKKALADAGARENELPVGEVAFSTLLDTTTGYATSIAGIFSTFGKYLYDQAVGEVQEYRALTDMVSNEVNAFLTGAELKEGPNVRYESIPFSSARKMIVIDEDSMPERSDMSPEEKAIIQQQNQNAEVVLSGMENATLNAALQTMAPVIKDAENDQRKGWDKDNKVFKSYDYSDTETDIGYGHMLDKTELKTGKIKIGDEEVDYKKDGLTQEQADKLFIQDLEEHSAKAKSYFTPKEWKNASTLDKALATELVFNGVNLNDFPNFKKHVADNTGQAITEILRYDKSAGKPLTNRTDMIKEWYGRNYEYFGDY